MDEIKLIIKDDNCTLELSVSKQFLSIKSDYFKNLFTNFKENTMSEVTVNVPNAKITMGIIPELSAS